MYAFSYEVPGNRMFYGRIKDALGPPPDGLLMHLVIETAGGLNHINVWSSRQEWEAYRDETVRPAVTAVLAQAGIPEPPAPKESPLEVVDLFAQSGSISQAMSA